MDVPIKKGKFYVEACITFSAAHHIEGHYKCGNPHGHNYRACVKIFEPTPMEIDLDELKAVLKKKVHDVFDHTYLNRSFCKINEGKDCEMASVTSEDLAKYIYEVYREIYPDREMTVRVCETNDLCVYYVG